MRGRWEVRISGGWEVEDKVEGGRWRVRGGWEVEGEGKVGGKGKWRVGGGG